MSGEAHTSTSKEGVEARHFEPKICECKLNSNEKVPTDLRKSIFAIFYSISWELKLVLLMVHVKIIQKKRQYTTTATTLLYVKKIEALLARDRKLSI